MKAINRIFKEADSRLRKVPTYGPLNVLAYFSKTDVADDCSAFSLTALPSVPVPLPVVRQKVYRGRFRREDLAMMGVDSALRFLTNLQDAIVADLAGYRIVALQFSLPGMDGEYFREVEDGFDTVEFRAWVRYTRYPKD